MLMSLGNALTPTEFLKAQNLHSLHLRWGSQASVIQILPHLSRLFQRIYAFRIGVDSKQAHRVQFQVLHA